MTLRTLAEKHMPRLSKWREHWEVHAPVTATLRLHEVLIWIIASNVCAIGCAPLAVGKDTRAVGDPKDYMLLWLILSSPFVLRWVYRQWIDRPSLPRQLALPWQWSPGVSSLIIMSMMSVVITSGRAAEEEIRALRSTADLRDDLSKLEAFVHDRSWSSALTDHAFASRGRSPQQDAVPWGALGTYVPGELLKEARTCSVSFFSSKRYSRFREECDSLPTGTRKLGPADAANLQQCQTSMWSVCFWDLETTLGDNLMRLLMAHHLYECDTSERAWIVLQLVYLSLFLGCVTGCAGVISIRILAATALTLAFLGLLLGPALYSSPFGRRLWHRWTWFGISEVLGGVAYGAWLVLLLAIVILRRRPRSNAQDFVIVLLLLWPLLVVALRIVSILLEIRSGEHYLGMHVTCPPDMEPYLLPYAVAGWIFLSGFYLLRYRTYRSST